jgi:hypothetical protein
MASQAKKEARSTALSANARATAAAMTVEERRSKFGRHIKTNDPALEDKVK